MSGVIEGGAATIAASDIQSASRLLAEGAFETAAAAFAALSAANPLDSDLPAFQTMALAKLGRLDDAEAVIAGALNLRLKNIVPLIIAAEVATLRSDWLVAALRWRRVAAGNPRSYTRWMRFEARPEPVTPWLRHVEALYRAGANAEADAAWEEALAFFPDNPALLRLPADIATESGNFALAGQRWTAALQRSGRHPAMVGAALGAAWEAGPLLREAGTDAAPVPEGYLVPGAAAQAWNDDLRAQVPLHYQRPISPIPSIEIIRGALVMPHMPQPPDAPAEFARTMRGGVFDPEGRIVPNAIQLTRPHVPDAPFGPLAAYEPLPGRWIFAAAHIYAHIGHFLMDCLGRLWAAERAGGPVDGLLFLTAYIPTLGPGGFDFRSPDRQAQFMTSPDHSYVVNLLRIFGGITNHRVATRPMQVEELLVPSQLLSLRPSDAASHPLFRNFVRRSVQAICDIPGPTTPTRIYLSRARLREDRGPLLGEKALERSLEAQGYAIIYPEKLSLDEQLRLYWNATHIITATGTAAHIAAMAMRGRQHVALLKRNPSQDGLFDDQLRAMGAASVTWVDAVSGHFEDRAPAAPRFRVYRAPHAVDVDRAMTALHRAGFVDDASAGPDAASEAEAMAQFLERLRRFAPDSDYNFVPRQG
ncbi:MAG: hypothetical protein JWO24_4132 [Rhodospirillales bacterium]|nr:hypothetical protein [Rhodospirillales bacterium]